MMARAFLAEFRHRLYIAAMWAMVPVAMTTGDLAMAHLNPHDTYMEVTEHPPTITEDDPRWDCRTMGNRICGPGRKD